MNIEYSADQWGMVAISKFLLQISIEKYNEVKLFVQMPWQQLYCMNVYGKFKNDVVVWTDLAILPEGLKAPVLSNTFDMLIAATFGSGVY